MTPTAETSSKFCLLARSVVAKGRRRPRPSRAPMHFDTRIERREPCDRFCMI
jgi:hypothetical protein